MIVTRDEIENLPEYFHFHNPEHEDLALCFLESMPQRVEFELNLQRSSIQLIGSDEPFAIIGFRREQEHIFVEFYSEEVMDHPRIVKSIESESERFINRVIITSADDIDAELLNWITISSNMLA